jgi:xylulose-5-phosphate/fructose-6-phosphate phosphoketolase
MITPTIKIKKEVANAARSANRIGRSSVKSEPRTAKKVFGNNGAISAYGPARSTIKGTPLKPDELEKIDAYWRASLYLCLGMLYLKDNPLLREPLKAEHTKSRLLGHWGSDSGQAFTYIHFNRLINKYDLNAIFISGP